MDATRRTDGVVFPAALHSVRGMTSIPHLWITDLFKKMPTLAGTLLEDAHAVTLPHHERAEATDAEATTRLVADRHADAVILLRRASHRPALAIVVEVQLNIDKEKTWRWPEYLTGVRGRHECDAVLLVVCPDPKVATWSAEPIQLGPGSSHVAPMVVGPAAFPLVTDHSDAAAAPVLAALSLAGHPDDAKVRRAVIAAHERMSTVNHGEAEVYADFVFSLLSGNARRLLEDQMLQIEGYEYQSDFARGYFAKGKAEGMAKAVLHVLDTRGIEVPDDARERISTCIDLEILDAWIDRAITATSIKEVLD